MRLSACLAVAWVLLWGAAGADAAEPGPWRDGRFAAAVRSLNERARRPEAIAPLSDLIRREEAYPAGALAAVLRTVVADRRTDPLVSAQAAYHLAIEEERLGANAEAEARWRGLGLLDAFWVVGPFDAQGRSGLGRAYGPEEAAIDPTSTTRFTGKEREVSWRPAGDAVRRGALLVEALMRPETDAVAYAVAYVQSDRARSAVVRLGAPGPSKVWVNGQLAIDRAVVRPPRLDQDAGVVSLRAGVNAVLVKSVVTTGPWRLLVRFTDSAGRALPDVKTLRQIPEPLPAWRFAAKSITPARTLGAVLQRRAQTSRKAEAWLDHARYLALVRSEDDEEKPIDAALERAVKAGAGFAAAVLQGELATEDDDRRSGLERAVATAPNPDEKAEALAALGEHARLKRRESAAVALFREALAASPRCWSAALALASEAESAGLPAVSLSQLSALPADVQALPPVRRARVRALDMLDRRREAESMRRALLAERPGDFEALSTLAASVRARGAIAEAAALYEKAVALRPELPFLALGLAQVREGLGDVAGAQQVLERAAARTPDEPRLHEALGKLLARAGQRPQAIVELRRALELRPQTPALRRFLDRLVAEGNGGTDRAAAAADLARDNAEDAEPTARAALMGAKDNKGGDGAVVLLDKNVVRVHRNGLSERFSQRVVLVRAERGVRDNQEFFVRYTPGSQEVEIRRARVFRRGPDGDIEISEATARDDRDLSEPWYGLYYDVRADVVVFEGLRAGDVLEVQYTLSDVSPENALADYFGDMDYIAESMPKRRWEYTLIAPAGRTFYFNQPALAGLDHKVERRDDETVYRFSARDIARVESEPSMPGWAEVAPYLHVSTYKSWDDVGRWYWHLVQDQLVPDEALRQAARAATAHLTDEDAKIRALHRFVLENTRYVGLEFGIHGFKPYRVSQVLSRRFGDCKDKASLLMVLLKEVGIDAELVLLRTRRGGRVAAAPASLAIFDHAITYVPSRKLYIDGTAEFSGLGELPAEDQGVMVLRVNARGSTLAETPVLESGVNRAARTWVANVDAGGAARIEETVTVVGQAAPEWRQHYQTPGERLERYGKVWAGRYPGAELESLDIDGIDDRNQPVRAHAVVKVPRLGEPVDDATLSLPISSREGEFVRSYARLSRRRQELLLAYPWQHDETLTFVLPRGWTIDRAPQTHTLAAPFGRFALDVTSLEGGRAISVHALVDVNRHRISPAEYEEFRRFLRGIDGALSQRLVLRKEARP